jgi:hypothetical protein
MLLLPLLLLLRLRPSLLFQEAGSVYLQSNFSSFALAGILRGSWGEGKDSSCRGIGTDPIFDRSSGRLLEREVLDSDDRDKLLLLDDNYFVRNNDNLSALSNRWLCCH